MTLSLVAVDYSRPIQPIFMQKPRVGTVHSVFRKAVNITHDSTILALLSDELPRMPNSVRLRSVVTDELLQPATSHLICLIHLHGSQDRMYRHTLGIVKQ